MFDTLSRWRRRFSPSSSPSDATATTAANPITSFTSNDTRQYLSISQPIPRSSPNSLAGGITATENLHNNNSNNDGGNWGNDDDGGGGGEWEEGVLNEIEDNRLMGSLGRLRMGSSSVSSLDEELESSGGVAPAVFGSDSVPPQEQEMQMYYQQQQYVPRHGLQRGSLRLQTQNVHHQQTFQQPNHPIQHQHQSTQIYHHPVGHLSPIAEQEYISPTSASGSGSKKSSLQKLGSANSSTTGGSERRPGSNGGGRRRSGSGGSAGTSGGGTGGSGSGESGAGTVGSSMRRTPSTPTPVGTLNTGGSPATPATAATIGTGTAVSPATATSGGGTPIGSPLSQYATPTYHSGSSAGPSPATGVGTVIGGNVPVNEGGNSVGFGTPEVTRPSPAYSSPFLTRQLNRTASQNSSRGRSSSVSTIPGAPGGGLGRQGSVKSVATSKVGQEEVDGEETEKTPIPVTIIPGGQSGASVGSEPPTIPPLDLRPFFPGPHPNVGPRPPKRSRYSGVGMMPTIEGSQEGYYEYEEEDTGREVESAPGEEADEEEYGYGYDYGYGFEGEYEEEEYGEKDTVRYADDVRKSYEERDLEAGPSGGIVINEPAGPNNTSPAPPSASESFITRRWDRDHTRGIPTDSNRMRHSITTIFLRAKTQRRLFGLGLLTEFTPAFWAFWLGFICPVLWLVGGWHFTNFGEQPPRMGVWEFYFSGSGEGWKDMFCCCLSRKRDVKGKGREGVRGQRASKVYAPLPRWISEKQSSDDGRARLNDPKRSLRGISFGYPFIARPPVVRERGALGRALAVIEKPNRLLDQMYGVKLREVRGRPESGRRMFDPWIQRCRYAFCYGCGLVAMGLCAASMYLIVFNTSQLR